MNIDVYDSYAQTSQGLMHFDVFVISGTPKAEALRFGRLWLKNIGEHEGALEQSRCNFCHSQIANIEIQKEISKNGYFILTMEGCPS